MKICEKTMRSIAILLLISVLLNGYQTSFVRFLAGKDLPIDPKYCYGVGLTTLDCDWYDQCLQKAFQCPADPLDKTDDSYPINFGKYFCNAFKSDIPNFPEEGKNWVNGTLLCLKRELVPNLTAKVKGDSSQTCLKLATDAFNMHPKCYTDNGFCELFMKDGVKVAGQTMMRLKNILMPILGFRSSVLKQIASNMLQTAKKCVIGDRVRRNLVKVMMKFSESNLSAQQALSVQQALSAQH